MPKYSVIIPIYNTEKYLDKCIKSVLNQTNQDFEIIAINDGSTDKSLDILNNYKNDITIINQTNQGLSIARNNGVNIAKGKYLIFLDSDDYLEPKLFENIDKVSKNNPDIIRYGLNEVRNTDINPIHNNAFNNLSGQEAFKIICQNKYVEPAWLYAINKEFYQTNSFEFMPNMYHEDFGIIPKIICLANKVTSIDYIGYNYNIRENSIMNDSAKNLKKATDFMTQGKILLKEDSFPKEYYSYIANSLITKANSLKGKDKKNYIKILKKMKISKYLLSDTLKRKIKKLIVKLSINLYLKVI